MNHAHSANCIYAVSDFEATKRKVLNWTQQFGTFCFLDNHQYHIEPHTFECLLGAGVKRNISCNAGNALNELQHFLQKKGTWLFGHLGYDLKNELESLQSNHPDQIGFPDLHFFEPEVLIRVTSKEIEIQCEGPKKVYEEIMGSSYNTLLTPPKVEMHPRFQKEEYITLIKKLKEHILRGDCYEINFCQEFYAEAAVIDPLNTYLALSAISPNPFSALYKSGDSWLLCASPERFLQRRSNKILSQPMKGTSTRVLSNDKLDEASKVSLQQSEKDRSENVMVVDLVRNDLSRVCVEGTVVVEELYGIYSFPQVHQMISTVSGQLKPGVTFTEIIRAAFPMGSMTGAPKKRVMELIEQYEVTRRGIFSGALGYITPGGDFDFNVVIRSIMYNSSKRYLSYQAGSGITFNSDPEKEWEECLMKAEAMRRVIEENTKAITGAL
jgi:para-aminobenzoate synthetase component 1